MLVWMRYAEGLMLAHAFLVVAYVVGASLISQDDDEGEGGCPSAAMTRAVCTCGLGLSVIGFCCFALALVGLLRLPAVAAVTLACILAGGVFRRESVLSIEYWRRRLRSLGACWDLPIITVYYFMLVVAFPEINLGNLGYDPVSYHLPYALDFATSGRLIVDPFLRVPFYASNFLLLDALMLLLHAQVLIMFPIWACGLLTALGIVASVRWLLEENVGRSWATLTALVLTCSTILSPFYLRWLDSAYIDVPIGTFALLATLCMVIAVRTRRQSWLFASAVTAGFLIGMKGSFLPLMAVFAVALAIGAWRLRVARRSAVALLAVLVAASSPWYVRNLIDTGDPVWPVLNLAVYGRDGLVTRAEEASVASDLPSARSAGAMASLPVRAFSDPLDLDFREYGTSAMILALYVPAALLLLVFLTTKRRIGADVVMATFIATMLVGYWAVTSTLLRYAILFFPLLAVCYAMVLGVAFRFGRWSGVAVAGASALTLLSSLGSVRFVDESIPIQYSYLPTAYTSDAEYQSQYSGGYEQAMSLVSLLSKTPVVGRVYVLGWSINYYLRSRGIDSVGDWIGPAGYFRLYNAIDAGRAPEFLNDLGVGAIMFDPSAVIGGLQAPLSRQLRAHGYCAVSVPGDEFELYVRASATESRYPKGRGRSAGCPLPRAT